MWKRDVYKRQQRKQYKFFKCPMCKQEVRVPRGHGKICITCPKCREPVSYTHLEELYHKVAKEVFSQYETTHTVNPARIVSMFTDEDEQREVACLLYTSQRRLSMISRYLI